MSTLNRQQITEAYLDEIGLAMKNLVERCGGTLEPDGTGLPNELVSKQRALFVHCGITSLVSAAVMDRDMTTLALFDWILGYHINKQNDDQVSHDQFIVTMLMALHEQVCKSYPDTDNPRFVRFVALYRLAVMTLEGFIDPEDFSAIDNFCNPLAERYFECKAEERKKDSEKN